MAVSVWILTLFRPAASLYTEISRLVYVDDEANVLCLIKQTRRGMAGVKVQYHTFLISVVDGTSSLLSQSLYITVKVSWISNQRLLGCGGEYISVNLSLACLLFRLICMWIVSV